MVRFARSADEMRMLVVVFGLAVLFAVGSVVVAATIDPVEPDKPWWDVHPPSSRDERAAAGVALRYARALQQGDATAACGLAIGPAARKCGTIRCGGDRVFHAQERGETVDVRLDTCHLTLARQGDAWRVVDQVPQVGLA